MKFLRKYRKRGMAAVLVAAALTVLVAPQLQIKAAAEEVTLLITPKTIIGNEKGDEVGWTEYSSDSANEMAVGNYSGAWYTQKIANTGDKWKDYAVYNNQNSNDISGFLWEASVLDDTGISLKMGVDNTFRHRTTSESFNNGVVLHDCEKALETVHKDRRDKVHDKGSCPGFIDVPGKYDWSLVPTKTNLDENGNNEDEFFFYFEDNDSAGLFLNGSIREKKKTGSDGKKYTEQYYTGFALFLNEDDQSAAYNGDRKMASGIYYIKDSKFYMNGFWNMGYRTLDDIYRAPADFNLVPSGIYQIFKFPEELEKKGLVTFGVRAGEEGTDSKTNDDNYTDVSFSSKKVGSKLVLKTHIYNKDTDTKFDFSLDLKADYFPDKGSVGFFSYSQPCATFANIKVTGTPPDYKIYYDPDGGKFEDGTTEEKVQDVELYDFEYVNGKKYYFPIKLGELDGRTVSRTGYHIKSGYNTPSKNGGWYSDLYDDDYEMELLSGIFYSKYYNSSITVQPAWEPNELTVKYDVNGGSGSINNTVMKYDKSYKLTSTVPTKDNYVFKGWSTKKSASSEDTLYTKDTAKKTAQSWASAFGKNINTSNKSVTLYAQWEKEGGYVQYHRNGTDVTKNGTYTLVGDLAGDSSGKVLKKTIKTTDTTMNLHNVTNLFARTGYHVIKGAEWLIGDTGLTVSQAKNTDMTNVQSAIHARTDKLVTLYANWQPNIYTIRFHGNRATSGSMEDMSMTYNSVKNLTKNAYDRDGYTFDGWTRNPDGTGDYYVDQQLVGNLTSKNNDIIDLYAKWKPNTLKIVYKPNGGTGSDVEANYTYNESIAVLSNQWFSKQFYHFTGWNTSADGRGDAYSPNTAIDWNTISFDANGQATLILYAQWLPNTFTIRYEPNGGNESPVTESYTYNKNITTASNTIFTRKGYYYDFWNTNSDGNGADYAPNTNIPWSFLSYDVNGHASMTLYAKWKPNIYTIRFHPNGGEGHMDDIKPVSYDTSVELPKCSYTKENEYGPSSFKGWNIVGDTKDYIFDDKATVKNVTELLGLENEKDVVVTLYAIWDDCPGIKSKDLYYTLEQAQSGYITEDELLNQAKAFDLEDNEIAPGTHENNSFRVMDYQESDFTKFEHSGSVTETYKVIDSYGNSYKEQITVYIVDTTPDPIQTNSDNTEKEGTTRFIDEKYYRLPYEQGGLQSNSIWLVDVEYRKSIENAFDNIKNSTPEALYEFSHGEILEMKEFVKMKGIGNTKEDSALQQFYNKFF